MTGTPTSNDGICTNGFDDDDNGLLKSLSLSFSFSLSGTRAPGLRPVTGACRVVGFVLA